MVVKSSDLLKLERMLTQKKILYTISRIVKYYTYL